MVSVHSEEEPWSNWSIINALILWSAKPLLEISPINTHTHLHTQRVLPEQHVSDRVRIRAQSYLDPKSVLSAVRDDRNLSWGVGVSARSHTGQLGPCVLVYIIWPEWIPASQVVLSLGYINRDCISFKTHSSFDSVFSFGVFLNLCILIGG